jgi:O-antigen ligase
MTTRFMHLEVQGQIHPIGSGFKPWPRDRAYSSVIVAMFWIIYLGMSIEWGWINYAGPTKQFAAVDLTEAYAANPAIRFIKLGLLAVSALIVLNRWAVASRTLREANPFFIAFLVMAPLSAMWSIAPGATIARFITLISFAAVCLAATMTNWYKERFQDILRPLMTLLCLGSLIVGFAYPDWVIEGGMLGKAWHGLFNQKNTFGQVSGLSIIFWLHGWLVRETRTWKAMAGMAIGMACLLYSRSSTSLFAVVFVACLMLMLVKSPRSMSRSMKSIVAIFAIVVVIYAVAVLKIVPGLEILLKPVTLLTGKDMTFSNRSMIWDIIKRDMLNWPLLGAGYSAYWIGPDPSSPSYKFLGLMYFYPTQSHSGYLEMANDLGYVGLFVLLGFLLVYVRQGVKLYLMDRGQGALFLSLFFQQCVINLSEATWFQISQPITTITIMFAIFAMARTLAEIKRTGQLPPRKRV